MWWWRNISINNMWPSLCNFAIHRSWLKLHEVCKLTDVGKLQNLMLTLGGMNTWDAWSGSRAGNSIPFDFSSWYILLTSFSSGLDWNTNAQVCIITEKQQKPAVKCRAMPLQLLRSLFKFSRSFQISTPLSSKRSADRRVVKKFDTFFTVSVSKQLELLIPQPFRPTQHTSIDTSNFSLNGRHSATQTFCDCSKSSRCWLMCVWRAKMAGGYRKI